MTVTLSDNPRKAIVKLMTSVASVFEMDRQSLANTFGLSLNELDKVLSLEKDLPISKLISVLNYYGVSIESVLADNVDYRSLHSRFFGAFSLPEKYAICPKTNIGAIKYMLDYVKNHYGDLEVLKIYRKLQINDSLVNDSKIHINTLLSIDVCDYIYKLTKDPYVMVEMGRNFYQVNHSSQMGKKLRDCKHKKELYSLMFDELIHTNVEQNYNWSIQKLTDRVCLVKGEVNSEVKDILGLNNVDSEAMNYLRKGFAISTSMFGDFPSFVNILKSIYKGDGHYMLQIEI